MYSLTHLHLVVNHIPIILTGLGLLLLAIAVVRRHDELARLALALFVLCGLSTVPAYFTGEPAEDTVENLPGVTEALIDRHEDVALVAAIAVGLLGAFALWTLWRYRRSTVLAPWALRVTLVAALVGTGAMALTGFYGGQIRHTEVRSDFVPPPHAAGETPVEKR